MCELTTTTCITGKDGGYESFDACVSVDSWSKHNGGVSWSLNSHNSWS